jgi:hypothetical protein
MTLDPTKLIAQGNDLQLLDQLYTLQNILNAAVIKNLLLVGQSEQARVETFINPNLYRLAVQYYGDVDYWTVIAKANPQVTGLDPNNPNPYDPEINGTVTLLIPPKPALDSNSILNPP